jgi:hypothetical protein
MSKEPVNVMFQKTTFSSVYVCMCAHVSHHVIDTRGTFLGLMELDIFILLIASSPPPLFPFSCVCLFHLLHFTLIFCHHLHSHTLLYTLP